MGLGKAIVEIIVAIIALIVIIAVIVFLIKLIAGIFVGLIVLAIIVGVGFWVYGRLKSDSYCLEHPLKFSNHNEDNSRRKARTFKTLYLDLT
jgi:membrane protein required for beta-lactamase induction